MKDAKMQFFHQKDVRLFVVFPHGGQKDVTLLKVFRIIGANNVHFFAVFRQRALQNYRKNSH